MTRKRKAKPGDKTKGIAYIRVSTDEQELGPAAQRAQIETWAKSQGIEILAWFEDIGVSGATELDGRPGFQAAVEALRAAGAWCLLVAKRDRLARSVEAAVFLDRAVREAGGRVVSAEGAFNDDNPETDFARILMDAFAAYERSRIRGRTKAALAALRASGKVAGTVPYGYTRGSDDRLYPYEPEQAVIASVWTASGRGDSQREITRRLAQDGVVGRTGRPLSRMQVQRILARA